MSPPVSTRRFPTQKAYSTKNGGPLIVEDDGFCCRTKVGPQTPNVFTPTSIVLFTPVNPSYFRQFYWGEMATAFITIGSGPSGPFLVWMTFPMVLVGVQFINDSRGLTYRGPKIGRGCFLSQICFAQMSWPFCERDLFGMETWPFGKVNRDLQLGESKGHGLNHLGFNDFYGLFRIN